MSFVEVPLGPLRAGGAPESTKHPRYPGTGGGGRVRLLRRRRPAARCPHPTHCDTWGCRSSASKCPPRSRPRNTRAARPRRGSCPRGEGHRWSGPGGVRPAPQVGAAWPCRPQESGFLWELLAVIQRAPGLVGVLSSSQDLSLWLCRMAAAGLDPRSRCNPETQPTLSVRAQGPLRDKALCSGPALAPPTGRGSGRGPAPPGAQLLLLGVALYIGPTSAPPPGRGSARQSLPIHRSALLLLLGVALHADPTPPVAPLLLLGVALQPIPPRPLLLGVACPALTCRSCARPAPSGPGGPWRCCSCAAASGPRRGTGGRPRAGRCGSGGRGSPRRSPGSTRTGLHGKGRTCGGPDSGRASSEPNAGSPGSPACATSRHPWPGPPTPVSTRGPRAAQLQPPARPLPSARPSPSPGGEA